MQWNSYEILMEVAEREQLDLVIFGANIVGEAPEWIWNKVNTKYKYYRRGEAKNVIFEEESARPFYGCILSEEICLRKMEKSDLMRKWKWGRINFANLNTFQKHSQLW